MLFAIVDAFAFGILLLLEFDLNAVFRVG